MGLLWRAHAMWPLEKSWQDQWHSLNWEEGAHEGERRPWSSLRPNQTDVHSLTSTSITLVTADILIHSEHCEQGYLCYWQKFKTFIANVLPVAYSNEVNGSVDHWILWILGTFRSDRSELNMTTMYSNLIFSISRAHRHFYMPWEFL